MKSAILTQCTLALNTQKCLCTNTSFSEWIKSSYILSVLTFNNFLNTSNNKKRERAQ